VRMGFLAMVIPSSISSKGVITSCWFTLAVNYLEKFSVHGLYLLVEF
jgi:hypothetical protein